jgi:hypothetical protein
MRQWDSDACEAAVIAQILYMGGKLRYPFDTAKFDQCLGRESGESIVGANGLRLIASLLPVTMHIYTRESIRSVFDRAKTRKALRSHGYSDGEITAYFNGPMPGNVQKTVRDLLKLQRELGSQRYRRYVRPRSSEHVGEYLRRGALVVATELSTHHGAPSAHSVLLIPRGVKRGKTTLTVFDPTWGAQNTTLDKLIAQGDVRLDECGFTAHML